MAAEAERRVLRSPRRRLAAVAAVGATVGVMALVYWSTMLVLLELGGYGSLNAVAFTSIALMCLLSFFSAALTDPGGVPASFSPDLDPEQQEGVSMRYCEKCCSYKPPRAHHCQVCKRCVLKMDHHCAWIGNCVGYANYKSYLLLVLHSAICSFYSMTIFLTRILQRDRGFEGLFVKLFYMFLGSIIVALSVVTMSLLLWHIYLLSHNMTTIEYREGVRAKWLAKKRGLEYSHVFDLGLYNNIVSTLGPKMSKWLCPLATAHLKDGTCFPTANG